MTTFGRRSASATPPPGESSPISRDAWLALAIGAAGFVLVGFNGTATNLAFDDITATYSGVPATTVGFVSSGSLVGLAAFLPLAGRIADRVGRTKIFLYGMLVFAISSVLSAVAPNVWLLIAARVVQSVGGAMVIPASLSMALPLFPESRRSLAVASWAAAGPASAAIAPSLSALILHLLDWRWLYFVSAPVALIVWIIGRRHLREVTAPAPGGTLDWLGITAGTTAIALFVFAIGKGADWGWASFATLGCLVAAMVSLVAFFRLSRRHREPLIQLALFEERQVWMANLANTLVSITSLSIWLVWPLFLSRVWGYNNLQIGLALTAGPIAAATMTVVGGKVADRFGHRVPIQLGTLIMVFAVGWCWLVLSPDGTYLTSFLPGIMAFGFGWGFSSPTMNAFALEAVPEAAWGAMNAAFNMLRNVAGAVGVAAAVAIIGSADRVDLVAAFDRAFAFFFAFTVASALVVLTLYPKNRSADTLVEPSGLG